MIILRLPELFKTLNRPGLTRRIPTVTLFDGLFLGKYKRRRILTQSSMKSLIRAIKFGIDIFDSLETMRFLAT